MIPFLLEQIVSITGGAFHGDAALLSRPVPHISIDSRTVGKDGLYVPIRGQVHDGHRFIDSAFEHGALLTLSETDTPHPHVRVPDARDALQSLARAYRRRFAIPVVGVTGSVGKTTTKEMVYAVLSQRFHTYRTEGNLNNQTGVPQAIFGIGPEHEAAILEMGTNHFGEIERLSWMGEPDCCLFTNIGESHIEFFGDRKGILKGKLEMLSHMRPGGTVIVNGDDDMLATVPGAVVYGLDPSYAVYADGIGEDGLRSVSMTVHMDGVSFPVTVHEPGLHMVYNALAAIAVGRTLGVSVEQMQRGIAAYAPLAGRMNVERLPRFTLLNDCYNANPTSVEASVRVLEKAEGRRVFIFGDMFELGETAPVLHARIGAFCRAHGVDLLLCVGELAKNAADGAAAMWFPTVDALTAALPGLIRDGDAILVKASRGMQLERVTAFLRTL